MQAVALVIVAQDEEGTIGRVIEAVHATDDFKFNVAVVLIDLFIRLGLIAVTVAFLTLATLARQNGIIVAACGALALGWLVFRSALRQGLDVRPATFRLGLAAAAGLALVGVLAGLATGALELRGNHWPETRAELTAMQIYDLAGAARRDPALRLDLLRRQAPGLETFVDGVMGTAMRDETIPGAVVVVVKAVPLRYQT